MWFLYLNEMPHFIYLCYLFIFCRSTPYHILTKIFHNILFVRHWDPPFKKKKYVHACMCVCTCMHVLFLQAIPTYFWGSRFLSLNRKNEVWMFKDGGELIKMKSDIPFVLQYLLGLTQKREGVSRASANVTASFTSYLPVPCFQKQGTNVARMYLQIMLNLNWIFHNTAALFL